MRNLVLTIGNNSEIQDHRIEALQESDEQLCRQALERILKALGIDKDSLPGKDEESPE